MNYKQKAEEYVRRECGLDNIPEALPLPVRYDNQGYYWGKNNEMVADFDEGVNVGDGFRIRGWGRIQHSKVSGKTPEQLQDECAEYIAEAVNNYGAISLQDWLRVLHLTEHDPSFECLSGRLDCWINKRKAVSFNLTTGQPLDYQAICELLNI